MTTPAQSTPVHRPEPAPIPWLLKEGDHVAQYRICRVIGEGSGGIVYEVEDPDGARFALKLSRYPLVADERKKNSVLLERFYHSAAAHLELRHVPNVARLVGFNILVTPQGAFPYLVMELVPDGESITAWAARAAPMLKTLVDVFIDIATALGKLADMNVCHRDLKPQNILITPNYVPMIVDLNSASFPTRKTITSPAASAIPGTPTYFSPELATAVLDEMRSGKKTPYAYAPTDDLYSLGCVFYEVLAGEVPCCELSESPETILNQIATWEPVPLTERNPSVPWSVAKVVMKLLKKNPAERYQSGYDVAGDLMTARHRTVEDSWSEPFIVSRCEPSPKLPKWLAQAPSAAIAPVDSSADKTLPASALAPAPAQSDVPQGAADRAEAEAAPVPPTELVESPATEVKTPPGGVAAEAPPPRIERPWRRWAAKLGIAVGVMVALVAWPIARQDCPPESSAEKGPAVLCKAKMFVVTAAFAALSCAGIKKNVHAQDEDWFAQCPAESRETMKRLRIYPVTVTSFPKNAPNVRWHDYGYELRAGPVEVPISSLPDRLGTTGSLRGEIRIDSDGASVRFTRLKLNNGDEFPVCGMGFGERQTGFRKRLKGEPDMDPASELRPEEGFIYVERRNLAILLAE